MLTPSSTSFVQHWFRNLGLMLTPWDTGFLWQLDPLKPPASMLRFYMRMCGNEAALGDIIWGPLGTAWVVAKRLDPLHWRNSFLMGFRYLNPSWKRLVAGFNKLCMRASWFQTCFSAGGTFHKWSLGRFAAAGVLQRHGSGASLADARLVGGWFILVYGCFIWMLLFF